MKGLPGKLISSQKVTVVMQLIVLTSEFAIECRIIQGMRSNDKIYAALASKVRTFLENGRTSEARRILAELQSRNVQSTVFDNLQAWCVVQTADHTTARAYAHPQKPSNWLRAFEAQWALKREREAVAVLKEGLKHHPEFVDFHNRLSSQYANAAPMNWHCTTVMPHFGSIQRSPKP